MTHRFCSSYRQIWLVAVMLVLAALLAACGGQQPTLNPESAVSITRTDGSATLTRALGNSEGDLPDSTSLAIGDQLFTAQDRTVTLQFPDGSTLQMGPGSHLVLFSVRPADRLAIFRLLSGSVKGDLRGDAFEVQGYEEVAINFQMVLTDLVAIPRGVAGTYQLGFDGKILKAVVSSGEFDMRSGNQQATLPPGWQAIADPGKSLQVVSLITPTPAPPSATEPPTATPIQVISITPTSTPMATRTAGATTTPTRTPTRVQATIISNTSTPAVRIPTSTPLPPPTDKPGPRPKPTNPPPPPPTNPPPPPPTNPP
ncbi:MAG: FecR domain-containing protein, partial [Chloroflexi bacterium]|nr:FecR domain-containing protein [Chloroflexota bacterium]